MQVGELSLYLSRVRVFCWGITFIRLSGLWIRVMSVMTGTLFGDEVVSRFLNKSTDCGLTVTGGYDIPPTSNPHGLSSLTATLSLRSSTEQIWCWNLFSVQFLTKSTEKKNKPLISRKEHVGIINLEVSQTQQIFSFSFYWKLPVKGLKNFTI